MLLVRRQVRCGLVLLCIVASSSIALHAVDCAAMKGLKLEGTTISVAEAVTSGRLEMPGMAPMEGLPSFCRVSGLLRPHQRFQDPFRSLAP